jgi:ABC-type transporter Mla MlaB component
MLKITNINDDEFTTFKLEGKLTGEWVNELKTCWQQAMMTGEGKALRIDLAGVTWVSGEGKALLCAIYRNGVEFLAANLLMAGIVAEISAEITD